MPDSDAEDLARRLYELQVDRDRWKARALDAERRYREREVILRQLHEDLDDARRDRDSWRGQTERLASTGVPRQGLRADPERLRSAVRRTVRAAWETMPEPGRRLARPLIARVRGWVPDPRAPRRGLSAVHPAPPSAPGPAPAGTMPPPPSPDDGQPVTETVSVVIPTFNAGPEFARTLDAILLQEGIGDLELLVVDSGSSDGTVATARARGARVVEIRPEEFSHGGTRDRSAAMSRGEVLVMTVQDALLADRQALRSLVWHLTRDPSLAAVSARQVPRLDCDLFGAFILFTHARSTFGTTALGPPVPFASLTLQERRALCAVDNVCAVIRREAWEALRFRDVPFAEDLDFGLRAVEQGWKVATATDVCVVHSHNRGARYHLGRFLIDRLTVSAFLGDPDQTPASLAGLEVVAASAVELLKAVQGASAGLEAGPAYVPFAERCEAVASLLATGAPRETPVGDLAEIAELLTSEADPDPEVVALLRQGLIDFLHAPALKEFARSHPFAERVEADAFVGKAVALILGGVLGDSMRDTFPDTPLATRLRQGV